MVIKILKSLLYIVLVLSLMVVYAFFFDFLNPRSDAIVAVTLSATLITVYLYAKHFKV